MAWIRWRKAEDGRRVATVEWRDPRTRRTVSTVRGTPNPEAGEAERQRVERELEKKPPRLSRNGRPFWHPTLAIAMIMASSIRCGGVTPWTPIGNWRIVEAESGYLEGPDRTLRSAPSQAGGILTFAADGIARYQWPNVAPGLPSNVGPPFDFGLTTEGTLEAQPLKWTLVVGGVKVVGVHGTTWDYRRDGGNRLKWSRSQGGVTLVEVWIRSE